MYLSTIQPYWQTGFIQTKGCCHIDGIDWKVIINNYLRLDTKKICLYSHCSCFQLLVATATPFPVCGTVHKVMVKVSEKFFFGSNVRNKMRLFWVARRMSYNTKAICGVKRKFYRKDLSWRPVDCISQRLLELSDRSSILSQHNIHYNQISTQYCVEIWL